MKYQRGFTIVELILVIVIIGILAAVVGPRFFDRKVFDERFYFEDVLSTVRYAQKLAVASGCYMRVSLDTSSEKFLMHRDANCGSATQNKMFTGVVMGNDGQNYSDSSKVSGAPQGVTIRTDEVPFSLEFGPLGCISENTPGACAATNRWVKIGEQFTVTVHAATGFIEVGQ